MNFEFKSTFKQHIIKLTSNVKAFIFLVDYSIWILIINFTSLVVILELYLGNHIIPASYGSGPNAAFWISASKVVGIAWTTTTLHALIRLAYRHLFSTLNATLSRIAQMFFESVRLYAFQVLLFIHLEKYIANATHSITNRSSLLLYHRIQINTYYKTF